MFAAVLRRDLLLAWRGRADLLVSIVFFVVVTSLFPFGVGSSSDLLRLIGSGVLWVAALLSVLLSLGRLFAQDFADGVLEQCMLSATPDSLWVLAKIFAHWLTTGLPLVLVAPLLSLLFDLPVSSWPVLVAALLLGTPVLTLLGAVGAALTLGLGGGGVLLALLVLPLFVPVLIFGSGAVMAHLDGSGAGDWLLLLGAGDLAALALAPFACAAALRLALE